VHYDSEAQRRPLLQRLVAQGELPAAYASDDGVGLLYRGTERNHTAFFKPNINPVVALGASGATTCASRRVPTLTIADVNFPPSVTPINDVTRVLVIAAHPDDADFGAAGTVAGWTRAGVEVAYCIVTRGDAGGFDDRPREQMPIVREAEQRAAAAEVGVKNVTFLDGYADGAVYVNHQLRCDITREIRRFRPQRVVTQSPLRDWRRMAPSHPDHLAVGEAVMCAVYPDARNRFAHPKLLAEEGLAEWTVEEVWLSGGPDPDHMVDITDTFGAKLAALRAHASQVSHLDSLEDMLRDWLSANAAIAGLPDGALAESFTVIDTR